MKFKKILRYIDFLFLVATFVFVFCGFGYTVVIMPFVLWILLQISLIFFLV